ncbi:U-box domain-containing protein 37-like [Magnolia sinica]|uniref:U-box domain-containing protein 37-like n=1 Tax=Magnolia sinica TaxID=86752 RepID=UPI00265B6CC7|nr:U-box domain-containing protein 37-like [Magnolia sinica]
MERAGHYDDGSGMEFGTASSNNPCIISEIEEENPNEPLEARYRIPTPVEGVLEEDVYVAVGKSSSSMDALVWTLKNDVTPATFVYLVHVFPQVHHIPTPLGKMPRNQVTPAQVESYLSQERDKRRVMLQKLLNLCATSKVQVDTVLIESNLIEKAIVDLIPVLNIRKLVLGTTKSNIRKGSGKARYVQKNAPGSCKVKIICEGKEVIEQMNSPPSSPLDETDGSKVQSSLQGDEGSGPISCTCFSTKFI